MCNQMLLIHFLACSWVALNFICSENESCSEDIPGGGDVGESCGRG